MENIPISPLNEEEDILLLNRIAESLETNMNALPPGQDLISLCNSLLLMAHSDNLIIAIIKCVTVYIRKNVQFVYELINKGLYFKIMALRNPRQNNPKVSLEVAIAARRALVQVFSYKEIINYRSTDFEYGIFIDNIIDFPLVEQKLLIKFTKDVSLIFTNDVCAFQLSQISQLLTHFDQQIVIDIVYIIYNCFFRGTTNQLKIIDPAIAKYISISLEVITDQQIILVLLEILCKSCQISYEYAEQIIDVPIDFGLIIHNIGIDPNPDIVNAILELIHIIFSFSTLRKGSNRQQKISNFAFYVQPLLIKLIKQNLGNIALALECLSITFDVYMPILDLNDILDVIVFKFLSGNKAIKIDSFYKKLIENQKIQDGLNQYDKLKIPNPNSITHITDFNSFIDASNLHSSAFAINETLQQSILKILKNINSQEIIKKSFSSDNYLLIEASLLKIVDKCQKTIIFNTIKPIFKPELALTKTQVPPKVQLSLFDQKGKIIHIEISNGMIFTLCESLFNFVNQSNTVQWRRFQLPMESVDNSSMYVVLNDMKGMINPDSLNTEHKSPLFNHLLCYKPNQRFSSSENFGYYRFYYYKIQGKTYSPFDNCFTALVQSNSDQVELIEIQKNEKKLTTSDFMSRADIVHKYKNEESVINFEAFHESFYQAYPTLNLQKRSFDYYNKVTIPGIEFSLRILKEVHRLFPDLHQREANNDNNNAEITSDLSLSFKSVFENEVFGWRLLEKLDFKSVFRTNVATTSTFINFPFLFTLEQRLLFLKMTALSQLKSSFTLLNEIYLKGYKNPGLNQQMNLIIDREKLFENGLTVFNILSPGFVFYDVHFKGENGTGRGPTQEFFRLFSLEMQKNKHGIWLSDNKEDGESYAFRKEERGLFPSPSCVSRPDLFFTLGSLCAKSIEMEIALPLHFSPSFFKLIRGEEVKPEEVSKSYAKSIEDKKGLIGLTFTFPGQKQIELRNGGKVLVTDEENVELYVELLRRVMTFNVFNINKEEEEMDAANNEGQIKGKNPQLKPVSSKAWKNLQKANSATLITGQQEQQQQQEEEDVFASASNSGSVRLKKGESQGILPFSNLNSSIRSPSSSTSNLQRSSSSSSTSTPVAFANNGAATRGGEERNGDDDDDIDDGGSEKGEKLISSEIADYIQKYSFECCASMFREGFGRIIPWSAMNLFTPEEICRLIEGDEELSIESLTENIVIGSGYESSSVQIKWLFEIVSKELSTQEKKLFTRFVTGSDSFGVFGLKSLVPKLTILKSEKSPDSLPSCSTCSNCLKIPEYQSKDILKQKLLYAIYECNEKFYMM